LNIDFGINERQNCKTGTMCGEVFVAGGVNGGDEGEGI
jgi:hypothetical protein